MRGKCKSYVSGGVRRARKKTCTGRPTAHTLARYRCSLPGLAGLAGLSRVGPGTFLMIPPGNGCRDARLAARQGNAMATLAHHYVPVEVYLRSSYEPDAEYVDGIIEERPMGEYDHAA